MKRAIAIMLFAVVMMTMLLSGCGEAKDDTPLDPVLPDEVIMYFVENEPLGRGGEIIRPFSTVVFSSEMRDCPIRYRYLYQGYDEVEHPFTLYHEYNPSDYTYREYLPCRFSEYKYGWPQEPGQYEVILCDKGNDYFKGTTTYIIAIIE